MPAYSKCTVVQLRDLCESRGIEHRGLLKSQLIEALCADDVSAPVDADNNGEMMPILSPGAQRVRNCMIYFLRSGNHPPTML